MKIAFDFDGTLEYKQVQNIAEKKIKEGHEVWIVTSRFDTLNREKYLASGMSEEKLKLKEKTLFDVAAKLKIPKERIHFTNLASKRKFLVKNEFDIIYDDDMNEHDSDLMHDNILITNEGIKTIIYSSVKKPKEKSKLELTNLQLNISFDKFILADIEIYSDWTQNQIDQTMELNKRRILKSIENYITNQLNLDII